MDFKIEHTWDGFPVNHEPVFVRLNPTVGGVMMKVSAPFFNDPPAPLGEPGKPFNELWDYEVVEAFFLNDITEQYLEVELCPHRLEYFKPFSFNTLLGEEWKQPESELWLIEKPDV
uniref:Chromosome 4 open reading frame 33 n=1 Tax=Ursus americanus TaxID=9643 RepID=A0A452QXY1_URSAM